MIILSTPNGKKVQIMLEELKKTYGTECELSHSKGMNVPPRFKVFS
jgi:hypothetical protein